MEVTPADNNANTDEETEDGSTWAVCGAWLVQLRNILPPIYRDELLQVFKLSVPAIIFHAMTFMVPFVSMVFCGHLGKTEFAGVSWALVMIHMAGLSIGVGLSQTCDTLVSQTYGRGNLKHVGEILQKGVLILLLACFPCWAVLINTETLLLAVKQNPKVASVSQLYVKIFMPALPATFMYQLQGRYLQNQGILWPQAITGVIGNVLNAIVNCFVLYVLDMGVAGSAAANTISQYVMTVGLHIYMNWRGLHKVTWGGWSRDCLQEWRPFVLLAFPSMFMLCLKLWLLEIGVFLAGVVSEVELGAQSILYQLNVAAFNFSLGIAAVASLRVGNALGAGKTAQAKISAQVSVICAFLISCTVGIVLTCFRHGIGYIFTKEQDIISRVAEVMVTFTFVQVADVAVAVGGGILRGTGTQWVGALCNLVGYYLIGFPFGMCLMFHKHMDILGLWIGFTSSAFLQASFFIAYFCELNWIKVAQEALVRAGAGVVVRGNETVEMDNMTSNQTQDQSSTAPPEGDCAEEDQEQPEAHASAATEGDNQSGKPVVTRRVLVLLFMIVILVVGMGLSDVFSPGRKQA